PRRGAAGRGRPPAGRGPQGAEQASARLSRPQRGVAQPRRSGVPFCARGTRVTMGGSPMRQYLDLLRQILDRGRWKQQRAVLASTGQKPRTLALFGLQARYDLNDGFPLVTTKRVPFRHVVEELLWFLSGSTSNRDLEARGVTIWREWADPETGELGPIYGQQWRRWEYPGGTFDQIDHLVRAIRAVKADPEH